MRIPYLKIEDVPAIGNMPRIPPAHLLYDGECRLWMADGYMSIGIEVTPHGGDMIGWVSQDAIRYARHVSERNEVVPKLYLASETCVCGFDGAEFPRPKEHGVGLFALLKETLAVTLPGEARTGATNPLFDLDLVRLHTITSFLIQHLESAATWLKDPDAPDDDHALVAGCKHWLRATVWNTGPKKAIMFDVDDTGTSVLLMPMTKRSPE